MTDYWRAPERFVEDFDNYPQIVNVVSGLEQRGYSEQDIHDILGRNFLRVLAEAQVKGTANGNCDS